MDHIGKDHAENRRVDLWTEEGENPTFWGVLFIPVQVRVIVSAFSSGFEDDVSPPEVVSEHHEGIADKEKENIGYVDNLGGNVLYKKIPLDSSARPASEGATASPSIHHHQPSSWTEKSPLPPLRKTSLLCFEATSRSIVDRMGVPQNLCVRRAMVSASCPPPCSPCCSCPQECERGSPCHNNGPDYEEQSLNHLYFLHVGALGKDALHVGAQIRLDVCIVQLSHPPPCEIWLGKSCNPKPFPFVVMVYASSARSKALLNGSRSWRSLRSLWSMSASSGILGSSRIPKER